MEARKLRNKDADRSQHDQKENTDGAGTEIRMDVDEVGYQLKTPVTRRIKTISFISFKIFIMIFLSLTLQS